MSKSRGRMEVWIKRHKHKLELTRTITSMIGAISSTTVLLKLFKII